MIDKKTIFVVKDGIPGVGSSGSKTFHLLSIDLKSNFGYIDKVDNNKWKLYMSFPILPEYRHLRDDQGRFYYFNHTFENIISELEKFTGIKPEVINRDEIETWKTKLRDTSKKGETITVEEEDISVKKINELNDLIGLENVKIEIQALRSLAKIRKKKLELGIPVTPSTLHMVFTGNPGTGKTTIARLIGEIYYSLGLLESSEVIEVSRYDLVGQFVGLTAVKTQKVFESALGGVLFIDEAYSLSKGDIKDFGTEAIAILIKLMEDYRDKIVVIVAGYPDEMKAFINSNPGLKSRFSTYIHFDDFSKKELFAIFLKMVSDSQHKITEGAKFKLDLLIDERYNEGYFTGNARTIRNIFEEVHKLQSLRLDELSNPTKEELITFNDKDVPYLFNPDWKE